MKNLLIIVLTVTGFVSSAMAESTFTCTGQDLTAHLTIGEARVKNGSYNECNGGVGDDMTDCHTRNYQIVVRDAVISLNIKEDTLESKMVLIADQDAVSGSDVLIYKGMAIQMTIGGKNTNPIVNLKFMAKGQHGNPVVVGDDSLSCKNGSADSQSKGVDMEQPVYKILREQEWQEFQSQGCFNGSKDDLRDGFIHLSKADQVERVIKKYFSTEHPIYIVKFENVDFLKRLVWELASNGDLYPHLYNASLSIDEVASFEVRN